MELNIPNRSSTGLSLIAGVFPLELPQNVTRLDIHHWVRFLCSNFFQATLAHDSKGKREWGGGEDLFLSRYNLLWKKNQDWYFKYKIKKKKFRPYLTIIITLDHNWQKVMKPTNLRKRSLCHKYTINYEMLLKFFL